MTTANFKVIKKNGFEVLVSYATPVAYTDSLGNTYRTESRYSVTTSKHVNKYCRGKTAVKEVKQSEVDRVYYS